MTGSILPDKKKVSIQQPPEEIAPAPTPILRRTEDEAKKKVKKRVRRTGRESTILADRMMSNRNNILNISLAPG